MHRQIARRTIGLLAVVGTATAMAGCSTTDSATNADGVIKVTSTDTECTLSRTNAQAGMVDFEITNKGSKVTEFYVLGAGDQVLSEVENITPGLTRELKVEITEAGTLTTACKPGMVGDGIRGPFEVRGQAVAAVDTDERQKQAVQEYKKYVDEQSDLYLKLTTEFVNLVKADKFEQAKALYPEARAPWERIEPIAESFGDLDPRMDGREADMQADEVFTGYHRLEKDLWLQGRKADTNKMADQLLADATELNRLTKTVELTPVGIASGAKTLLDEVAKTKIGGEEEVFSHTDLWDFDANVQGSQYALQTLRPVLQERDPQLLAQIDERFGALNKLLQSHRKGTGFKLYTELTPAEVKALQQPLSAVSESVAKVPAVIGANNESQ